VDSNYEQDSFNNNIMKIYEDHKKHVNKTEIQNLQRPISSYHRGVSGKREETEGDFNLESFISKFNTHIWKFKIKKNDFIDNPDIFFDKKEFHKLFKNIRFEVTSNELQELFSFRNSSADEGYILGKTFLNNFNFKWAEEYEVKPPEQSIPNSQLVQINKEFKSLKEEVLEIIEKEIRSKSTAKGPAGQRKVKSSIGPRPSSKTGVQQPTEQTQRVTDNTNPSAYRRISKFDTDKLPKRQHSSHLFSTYKKKKQAEEEFMRIEILKRNIEYEKECIRKMNEADMLANELGIMKAYTAYKIEVRVDCVNL
jgi:hypothetical protein